MDPYPSSTWFCTSTGAEDSESINFQFPLVVPALSGMIPVVWVPTMSCFLVTEIPSVLSLSHSTPCLPNTCCALTCCLQRTEHPPRGSLCWRSTSELWALPAGVWAVAINATLRVSSPGPQDFYFTLVLSGIITSMKVTQTKRYCLLLWWSLHISFPSLLFQTFST